MAQFEDGKDEGALRTIGEVSEALGIKPHVLRYWEQQFALLKPLKRSGGRRYYRQSDVALVETIDRLVNREGYTLKGAEAVLRAQTKSEYDRRRGGERRAGDRRASAETQSPGGPGPEAAPKLAETLAGLKRVRDRLARALEA
ncbi:MerR family transcriptional regulator [Erythrobacter sp.]|uniref:MerR family transcriptional regulator n=1 Tax=Erythrobacter sp. TaxID=1042 RepID=UPI001426015C|nr:MerR family transcriptional regulator [Erythrobacter sp.]QIQ85648.1 MAG: MerR family transcriptional regulator [Erythrobacter sp.]